MKSLYRQFSVHGCRHHKKGKHLHTLVEPVYHGSYGMSLLTVLEHIHKKKDYNFMVAFKWNILVFDQSLGWGMFIC